MSKKRCLNPILAFMKKDKLTGKYKLSNFRNLRKKFDGVYVDSYDFQTFEECVSDNKKVGYETVLLPCRKCINCQLNRSQEWAIRNSLESKLYDSNQCLFITLTYDNDHVVDNSLFLAKNNSIENLNIFSLKKTDLQIFIKKLRDVFKGQRIRFFACGEYGGITLRPHYHILIYGLSLDDIRVKKYQDKNYAFEMKYATDTGVHYFSELLEKEIWCKGFVDLTTFSDFTSMYTSRYCTKKFADAKRVKGHIYYNSLQPQFNTMSLKPSIANDYVIKDLEDIYKNDEFIFHVDEKTYVMKPFAFFDKKYDIENPDNFKFIKENRKDFSDVFKYFKELDSSLSISEYLRNEEDIINKKLKERNKV